MIKMGIKGKKVGVVIGPKLIVIVLGYLVLLGLLMIAKNSV